MKMKFIFILRGRLAGEGRTFPRRPLIKSRVSLEDILPRRSSSLHVSGMR
jgi:hypothetical protein